MKWCCVSVSLTQGNCEQVVRVVDHRTKYEECKKIVDALHTDARVIVFCNRKHDVRDVEEQLWNSGAKAGCPLLPPATQSPAQTHPARFVGQASDHRDPQRGATEARFCVASRATPTRVHHEKPRGGHGCRGSVSAVG